MSLKPLAWTCTSLLLVSGCLIRGNPVRGTAANGKSLGVTIRSGTSTYTTTEVVDTANVSVNGSIHTVDVHGDVEHTLSWKDFSLYQGSAAIDEEDFYRLAGDTGSQQEVHARRNSLIKYQKYGLGLILGGLALSGVGSGYGIANNSTGLAIGGLVGGIVVLSFGSALYGSGRSNMRDKVVSVSVAVQDADTVEVCKQGDCGSPRPGGRKFRGGNDATTSERAVPNPSSPRPEREPPRADRVVPVAPPPRAPTSVVGTWRGTISSTLAQPGQTPSSQNDEVTFEVEPGPGKTVVFWPNNTQKDPRCRITATLAGSRATFATKRVCTVTEGGKTTTISVQSGTLELRGSELHVALVLDVAVRAGKNVPQKGTITYRGVGRP